MRDRGLLTVQQLNNAGRRAWILGGLMGKMILWPIGATVKNMIGQEGKIVDYESYCISKNALELAVKEKDFPYNIRYWDEREIVLVKR